MVVGLFTRKKPVPSVDVVYGDIVAAARLPRLYRELGVPDTVMGRFDSLAAHLVLVLRHLRSLPPPAEALAQELVDRFFADLDLAMREIGIGDVSVPKKVKALGRAFYGRAEAYEAALAGDAPADALERALARNVLERPDDPALATALAQHIRKVAKVLDPLNLESLLSGSALQTAAGGQ
jgi:cytochrome b pre-mRNA-processing protein 3